MIIYGTGSAHLKTEKSSLSKCPNCENTGTISFTTHSKHAHIFWIPLFPYGKTGGSHCSHCEQVLKKKQMPEALKRDYDRHRADAKPKIWQFSGLVLIAIFISWGIYASSQDTAQELTYLTSPRAGDVYEYKTDNGRYSSMRFIEILEDSIIVQMNDYEVTKASGLYKINKEENYGEDLYTISRDRLQTMYDEGDIYNIRRK